MKKWLVLILFCILVYGVWAGEAQGSIILKATVVNPSKTKTQTAILRAYLPKETSPDDIVDLGDLKIDYDITRGLYYVYKECELAPGESVMRSVEIKDVWVISAAEINALTGRAKEIVEKLKKTAYFDTAAILQKDIESKTGEIIRKQEKAANSLPQTHIAVYRDNVDTLNSIKTTLARLDDMLLQAKVTAPKEGIRGKVSVQASWWVIMAVIITLGFLSFVFFIIWHRQATGGTGEEEQKEETEEMPPPEPEDKGQGTEDKGQGTEDKGQGTS